MRIFLDANILFSAAYRQESPASLLFQLAKSGFCDLITSAFAVEEARRNIATKYPDRLAALDRHVAAVKIIGEADSAAVKKAVAIGLPEKDAPILAAAVLARADILVTGDRTHFGQLFGKKVVSVAILTLNATLNRIIESAG